MLLQQKEQSDAGGFRPGYFCLVEAAASELRFAATFARMIVGEVFLSALCSGCQAISYIAAKARTVCVCVLN